MTAGRDEDEWRKRITAKLSAGTSIVLIDNVGRRLESDALSSAITAAVWEDRLLGSTQMLSIPVRCAWAATANNARLSHELARRTVRCRLDAKMERPWERKTFRHNLPEWAAQHRAELIWAALVLIQAWLACDRPRGSAVLGGFESWSRVIGGVLSVAETPGFLANVAELYDLADVEGAENRRLVSAWWTKHGPAEVGVDTLFSLATSDEVNLTLSSATERGQRMQLGHRLASLRDRRYVLTDDHGEFTVRVASGGVRHSTGRWHLALESGINPPSPPTPPAPPEPTEPRGSDGEPQQGFGGLGGLFSAAAGSAQDAANAHASLSIGAEEETQHARNERGAERADGNVPLTPEDEWEEGRL